MKRWWASGVAGLWLAINAGCQQNPAPPIVHGAPAGAVDPQATNATESPKDPATASANPTSEPSETHTLFNPEPRSELKPMVTDRPGQTNGPYTVAPGHLQIETGLIDYTYGHAARLSRVDAFGGTEFRIGLVPDGEFDLVLNPFSWQRQAGLVTSGFGDVGVQGKWTIWADPSGNSGFGLIPFVIVNTAQRHLGAGATQGGMAFPLQLSLPADFSLGFMPGVSAAPNGPGGGYHPQVAASVSLSRTLMGNLSAFGEFAANLDAKHPFDWSGTVDFGLIYLLTNDLQLDLGMNVGVTRAAPDLAPFLGLSVRF